MRLASASSCCGLRNRNEGSGLMLNGFWVKPKKALYIFTRYAADFLNSTMCGTAGHRELVQEGLWRPWYGYRLCPQVRRLIGEVFRAFRLFRACRAWPP